MYGLGVGTVHSALTTRTALLAVAVLLLSASVCSAADGPLPSSPAVDALLADGPFCGAERTSDAPSVTGDAPHIKVVYAHASDVADRFALFGTAIQRYTKAAAAKVALTSDKTLRLDRGSSCGSAFLDIQVVALGHPVAFYATGSVLADVASRLPDRPGVNYLVFVDFALPVLQAAAGSWAQDDSPWATNVANLTAHSRYAYLQAGGEDFFGSEQPASQYADQVLHEVLHTLGAVQPSAPHFSGGAHCYQLFDVMCYTPRDGTSDGFLRDCELGRTAPNPGKPLDCGGDDYFNASPAPGSYLAAHWNLYDSGFLCTLGRCDQPPVAPAARLAVVAGDGQSVTVSAASSADPDGAVRLLRVGPGRRRCLRHGRPGGADGGGSRPRRATADRGGGRQRQPGGNGDDHRRRAQRPRSGGRRPRWRSRGHGDAPGTISDPTPLPAAALDSPRIAVADSRVASAPRLQLSVGRRTTLKQVRERGLQVMLAASRDLHVSVALRRGTSVLARRGFAATRRARRVTLRLTKRQLRDLGRRSATTLTVEISAAGAISVHRRIVILRAS